MHDRTLSCSELLLGEGNRGQQGRRCGLADLRAASQGRLRRAAMTLRRRVPGFGASAVPGNMAMPAIDVLVRLSANKQARLSLNKRLMSNVPTEVHQLLNLEQGSWGNIGI